MATVHTRPQVVSQSPLETHRVAFGNRWSLVISFNPPITGRELVIRRDIEDLISAIVGNIPWTNEETEQSDATREEEAKFYLRCGLVAALKRLFNNISERRRPPPPTLSVTETKVRSLRLVEAVPIPHVTFRKLNNPLQEFKEAVVEILRSVSTYYKVTPRGTLEDLAEEYLLLDNPEDFSEYGIPLELERQHSWSNNFRGPLVIDRHWNIIPLSSSSLSLSSLSSSPPRSRYIRKKAALRQSHTSTPTRSPDPLGITKASLGRFFSGSIAMRRRRQSLDQWDFEWTDEKKKPVEEEELEDTEEEDVSVPRHRKRPTLELSAVATTTTTTTTHSPPSSPELVPRGSSSLLSIPRPSPPKGVLPRSPPLPPKLYSPRPSQTIELPRLTQLYSSSMPPLEAMTQVDSSPPPSPEFDFAQQD